MDRVHELHLTITSQYFGEELDDISWKWYSIVLTLPSIILDSIK